VPVTPSILSYIAVVRANQSRLPTDGVTSSRKRVIECPQRWVIMFRMQRVIAVAVLALSFGLRAAAQEKPPLRLLQTVSVPGVTRKWDHFGVDLKQQRLFVTSEKDPVVEVFDLRTNEHIRTVGNFKEPHNVLPFPELNEIFVVDGEASEVKILRYDSYDLIGLVPLSIDADPVVYDPATKYLWVVNGGREAHTPYCLISIVDTGTGKRLADIKLDTNRLESMAIENSGSRLFVNMTGANEIGVVDRKIRTLVATWPITAGQENVPMQYDDSTHRLFVVTRKPSKLVVLNTDTGKEVTNVPVAEYADDLAYDAVHHRLYVACGGVQGARGAVSVVQQDSADKYRVIATIPTQPGAKTGRLVPELSRYYIGVPGSPGNPPQILAFEVVP
jgi:DNA-binding beta-propeller fold protein YncE